MPDQAPRRFVRAPLALLKLAPPFSFLYVAIQQLGSSYPLSRLKRVSSGVVCMLSDSLRTSSMALFARCKIFISAQLIGWSFIHACSGMADLSGSTYAILLALKGLYRILQVKNLEKLAKLSGVGTIGSFCWIKSKKVSKLLTHSQTHKQIEYCSPRVHAPSVTHAKMWRSHYTSYSDSGITFIEHPLRNLILGHANNFRLIRKMYFVYR